MPTYQETTYDKILKYMLLVFIAAMMVCMIYSIFGNIEVYQRVVGCGISLFGIAGFVRIAIFKIQLDKAQTGKERSRLIEMLLEVFSKTKNQKDDGAQE